MHCWHGQSCRRWHTSIVHCRRAYGKQQGAESADPCKCIISHSWAAHGDHPDISGRPLQRCPHATQRRLHAMLLSSVICMQSWLEHTHHLSLSLNDRTMPGMAQGSEAMAPFIVPQRAVGYREGM